MANNCCRQFDAKCPDLSWQHHNSRYSIALPPQFPLQDSGLKYIYCSPFLRTAQTAHQVARLIDVAVRVEHGLCEGLLERESCQVLKRTACQPRARLSRTSGALCPWQRCCGLKQDLRAEQGPRNGPD